MYMRVHEFEDAIFRMNQVWRILYEKVDILWVVDACIFPRSESRLLYLLRVGCLLYGCDVTYDQ